MSDKLQLPDLKEYALNYLARYSNTEAGLKRLLNQKVNRWIRMIKPEGRSDEEIEDALHKLQEQIEQIIQKMKKVGGIDDENFATLKIPALLRSGYSQKLIQKRFVQKGIPSAIIHQALEQFQEEDVELGAALTYAKRRKIGPFRPRSQEKVQDVDQKEQVILARRGFPYSIVNQLMAMSQKEAAKYIAQVQRL